MLYLLAFFLPPAALLFAGKPVQAIFSFCIYTLAWITVFLFFIPGFFFWGIAVVHAVLVINSKRADQRTEKIVEALTMTNNEPKVP
jgi:hypothetical protein